MEEKGRGRRRALKVACRGAPFFFVKEKKGEKGRGWGEEPPGKNSSSLCSSSLSRAVESRGEVVRRRWERQLEEVVRPITLSDEGAFFTFPSSRSQPEHGEKKHDFREAHKRHHGASRGLSRSREGCSPCVATVRRGEQGEAPRARGASDVAGESPARSFFSFVLLHCIPKKKRKTPRPRSLRPLPSFSRLFRLRAHTRQRHLFSDKHKNRFYRPLPRLLPLELRGRRRMPPRTFSMPQRLLL